MYLHTHENWHRAYQFLQFFATWEANDRKSVKGAMTTISRFPATKPVFLTDEDLDRLCPRLHELRTNHFDRAKSIESTTETASPSSLNLAGQVFPANEYPRYTLPSMEGAHSMSDDIPRAFPKRTSCAQERLSSSAAVDSASTNPHLDQHLRESTESRNDLPWTKHFPC